MKEAGGVHAELADLMRLEHQARGFTFLPRHAIHSLLSGRYTSRLRGRGLDFEELRQYLPGDDVRSIDWKVTARTGKPHTRVFTEERDRPVLLVVDQRLTMFFGSRVRMKSVQAAHAAALAAWRIVSDGDRVGALVFNDTEVETVRPHRSKNTVMTILRTVCRQNQALRVDAGIEPAPGQLNRVLAQARRSVPHDGLVVLISDLAGMDDETSRHLLQLSRQGDAMLGYVYDPLGARLPDSGRFVVGDGEMQVEIDAANPRFRRRFDAVFGAREDKIREALERLRMPVIPLPTHEDVTFSVRRALGFAGGGA